MRIEIVIFFITALIIANIYTDGKYLKKALTYQKYYQMIGVAFGALMLYWLFKKNPGQAHQMLSSTNEYLKYLPIDQNTSRIINPILDFTSKHSFSDERHYDSIQRDIASNERCIMKSGKSPSIKRSVSETKKKFVSARQNWRCAKCNEQLNAYFEVDHKIALKHGGSNHVDNLESLCPNCHREKTALDNMNM